MNKKFVFFEPYRVVKSYLTNRDVILNNSPGFLIPPTFSIKNFRRGLSTLSKRLALEAAKRGHENAVTAMVARLQNLDSKEDVARAIEKILRERQVPKTADAYAAARIRDLFFILWTEGCLIFPQSPGKIFKFAFPQDPPWDKYAISLISKFASRQGKDETSEARLRSFKVLLLSRGGVRSVGDLTPEVCGDFFKNHMVAKNVRPSTVSDIINMQRSEHKAKVTHAITDFGPIMRTAVRTDNKFEWVVKVDSSLSSWVDIACRYIKEKHRNLPKFRNAWNKLFDFLLENRDATRNPIEFLHVEYVGRSSVSFGTSQSRAAARDIFDWILDNICVYEDEYGIKTRLPGHANPIEEETEKRKRPFETSRQPMPMPLVRRLTELLTENDYQWPREYGVPRWNRKGGDYVLVRDAESKEYVSVWSPVRAISVLVKLKLPPRTFQVRVLDSGEADSETFYGMEKGWGPNVHRLGKANKVGTKRGVFYKHIDQDGSAYTFLYFNTSKTGDIGKDANEQGYVMQWQHPEVLDALVYLRDWQMRYNPIHAATPWTAIKEVSISGAQSEEVLSLRGSACFLFRDACSPFNEQPVTDARINTFWLNLNAELEKRLRDAGEVGKDGKPIALVKRDEKGTPTGALYDLHTLRVTHITAYAEAGVPIHIIMKVVDHKSVAMALHYIKVTPAHISETLNATTFADARRVQDEWVTWLSGQAQSTLVAAAAYGHRDAIEAFSKSSPSTWILRDHGICPVACARCDEGGPLVVDTKAYKKYASVPGGASNCVRCRFFITGPAFLLGLQANFDKVGFQLQESSRRYQDSKGNYERMEAEISVLRQRSEPVPAVKLRALEHAAGIFEQDTHTVDDKALSWNATYRLIGQCLAISRRNEKDNDMRSEGRFPLVAIGGTETVEAILEESTEFELADRVCQSSVFFSGIDAAVPNLIRMRAFDAMLSREGFPPCFFEMDEQQALIAGNQLAKLLYAKIGRTSSQRLMLGQTTLSRLGIATDFKHLAETALGIRLNASKARYNVLE